MKISTRTRYGLRALIEIAANNCSHPVNLDEISKKQNISRRYLENIMRILKSNGIVDSVQGKYGGFILKHKPEKITCGDIVEVLEGRLNLVDCLGKNQDCDMKQNCVTYDMWKSITECLKRELNKITLAELTRKHNDNNKGIMYYI